MPPTSSTRPSNEEPPVLAELRLHLTGKRDLETPENDNFFDNNLRSRVALPVAAIKSLLAVIKRSNANTMMGLQMELSEATHDMLEYARSSSQTLLLGGRSHIALASGCELFMKYVTRCFLELPDFAECKAQVLERGERFAGISLASRDRIAEVGQAFVQDGHTVLTHGWSRVVSSLLLKAAAHKHFSIIVLEGRPDASGAKAAKVLSDAGIPCTVVLDSAMGYVMEKVDLVIVGAEGVVENGGIVNKIGTYALGIAARELGKPFYVAAESYKFARLFPLNQSDLPDMIHTNLSFVDTASWEATGGLVGKSPVQADRNRTLSNCDIHDEEEEDGKGNVQGVADIFGVVQLSDQVKVENPSCDYTPAKYISLLFTDLGVLTPSAVSDELIRLYQ